MQANQQLYFANIAWKPSVGELCVYKKKGDETGHVYQVVTVELVDPTHVPNDLVVKCTIGEHGARCADVITLVLLRSGDWVVDAQRNLKRPQRDTILYMNPAAAAEEVEIKTEPVLGN